MSESYEVASVSGGKFHRLADPVVDASGAWRETLMACGRRVEPANYFETVAEALDFCGGRSEWLCVQCGGAR